MAAWTEHKEAAIPRFRDRLATAPQLVSSRGRGRHRAARAWVLYTQLHYPRLFADVDLDTRRNRHYDWLNEMLMGMSGRL